MQKVVVEFGDKQCRNMLLRSCGMRRVRGRFALSERVGANGGAAPSVGDTMMQLPALPGTHAEIDFGNKRIRFYDPLEKDQEAMSRANNVLGPLTMYGKGYRPHAEAVDDFGGDKDKFVTAVLEIQSLENNGSATVKSGAWPADMSKYGAELYDRGNAPRGRSRYKKEVESELEAMDAPK